MLSYRWSHAITLLGGNTQPLSEKAVPSEDVIRLESSVSCLSHAQNAHAQRLYPADPDSDAKVIRNVKKTTDPLAVTQNNTTYSRPWIPRSKQEGAKKAIFISAAANPSTRALHNPRGRRTDSSEVAEWCLALCHAVRQHYWPRSIRYL